MIPLEGEGTTGMGRVKGRARGVDGRELECGCEQRSKEHVREEHGAGDGRKTVGEMGFGLCAEEQDGGTEAGAVDRLEGEQGAWVLLWGAGGRSEEDAVQPDRPWPAMRDLYATDGERARDEGSEPEPATAHRAPLLLFVPFHAPSDHHFLSLLLPALIPACLCFSLGCIARSRPCSTLRLLHAPTDSVQASGEVAAGETPSAQPWKHRMSARMTPSLAPVQARGSAGYGGTPRRCRSDQ